MITTLAVAGYRSLRDVVLPLSPLTVVTGANGSGKSNLYRAMALLASAAGGGLIGAVAREGGLPSLLWAGPEGGGTQGTVRREPIAAKLGFASDELGYLVDLGIPGGDPKVPNIFERDPEIKREQIFTGAAARPATLLVDRRGSATRVRDDDWRLVAHKLAPFESVVTDLADADAPELLALRRQLGAWRFYDHFRIDRDAPARRPQVGTRSPTLAADGSNLAAAWATMADAGFGMHLDRAVSNAFPGARVQIEVSDGVFTLSLRQPGLLRPLAAGELSDGTLRFLLLVAALVSAKPAPLLVVNEPEASLHVSLLPALAELIVAASEWSQIVVVSHAAELVDALPAESRVELKRTSGGTVVDGQGFMDVPAWNWGRR